MHAYRLVTLVGIGFAALSMVLPFASFTVTGAVTGVSAEAWPVLLPLVPLAVLMLNERFDDGLDGLTAVAAVFAGATALIFAVVKLADALVAVRDATDSTLGPGAWVLVASVSVVVVATSYGAFRR